jgi:signal peptidase I
MIYYYKKVIFIKGRISMSENNDTMESSDVEFNRSEHDSLKTNLQKKGLSGTLVSKGSFFREWIIPIIAAIGIAFLINKFLIYNVYIPSESMVPTLNIGDKLVVTRVYDTSKIKRGDIIVFYSEELNEVLIKRAIGLPGDHIVLHNGIVNINGEDIKENYVKNNEVRDGVFDVPKNKFFFLGDNRIHSYDSRKWINPYIDASNIQGKAQLKYYPFKDFGSLK